MKLDDFLIQLVKYWDKEKIIDKSPPPTLRQLLKEQRYQEMQEKEKFVKL